MIEVHHCCCLGGLLGGLGAWHGGSGGISKGGYGLGLSCTISFPCLCVKAAAGDHPIEVHCCFHPGGLLGGIGVGRGGLYGLSVIGFVWSIVLFLFHSFSFASRLLQVVGISRSIVAAVQVDS